MNAPNLPSQTLSYLRKRFDATGIRPLTRFGQNFLIDLNLHRVLVTAADLGPRDVVLEVGTGTGALTGLMADSAAAVVTVEVDQALFALAREQLLGWPTITMLHTDVLKNKNTLNPSVVHTVQQVLAKVPESRLKLVANLPYNIATPLISNLLRAEILPFSMTVTIQRELAERIMAGPGSKDYGALSVWIQAQCHGEIVRYLPPSVFWPRPKVESAIIHLEVDQQLRQAIPDRDFFHEFLRGIFLHRRKFLRAGLLSTYKRRLGKPEVDHIMTEQNFAADTRAEQLDLPRLLKLCEAIRLRLNASSAESP